MQHNRTSFPLRRGRAVSFRRCTRPIYGAVIFFCALCAHTDAGVLLRKYGVATTVTFRLFETDGINFKINAAHVAGDTKIMKDEGVDTGNTTNGFVDEGNTYSIALTATEMEAARIVVLVMDQGTAAWLDMAIVINTYGHASAQHAFDFDNATQDVNVVEIDDDTTAADNAELFFDGTGYAGGTAKLGVDVVQVSGDTTAANNQEAMFDGTGYTGGTVLLRVDAEQISASAAAANSVESNIGNLDASVASRSDFDESTDPVELLDSGGAAGTSADELVDDNWNELSTGHVDAGKAGAQLWTDIDAILIDTAEIGAAGAGLTALASASNLATVDTVVDSILIDTAEIGTAGAGLTDLGGMSTGMKAEIESEVDDALVAKKLDHLVAVDGTGEPANNSLVSLLAAGGGNFATFNNTTDSLEALRDAIDAASCPTVAQISDGVWDEPTVGHDGAGTFGEQAKTDIDAILADTNELQSDDIPGLLATIDGIVDGILVDTDATIPGLIAALNDFDPASDTVKLGDVAHGGAAASLTLEGLSIIATSGDAVEITGAAGRPAVDILATVGGKGVVITSGGAVAGLECVGTPDISADITGNLSGTIGGFTTAAKGQIQDEATDAIEADNLDHLIVASASGLNVADNSLIAQMVSKSATADWDSFDNTTDSLEALRDKANTLSDFDESTDPVELLDSGGSAGTSADELVDDVFAETVDGETVSTLIEASIAVLFGKTTVTGNTVTFKKRDGTTTKVTIIYDGTVSGKRDTSTIN